MYTRSPGCSDDSRKKTPGPALESMCPAMTADPVAPGRGLPVYQPATAVDDGTCSAPSAVSPRWTMFVCTPIDGMVSDTGWLITVDRRWVAATIGAVGAGRVGAAP